MLHFSPEIKCQKDPVYRSKKKDCKQNFCRELESLQRQIDEIKRECCPPRDKGIICLLQDLDTSQIFVQNLTLLGVTYPIVFTVSLADYQKYYDEGYRVFLSITTSSVLKTLLPFFAPRPDAFLISCISISSDPVFTFRTMRNVYRLAPNNSFYTQIEAALISLYSTIYLVYQAGDNASENEKDLIQSTLRTVYGKEPILKPITSVQDILDIEPLLTANTDTGTVLSASTTDLIDAFHQAVAGEGKSGYFIEYYASLPNLDPTLADRYTFVLFEPQFERNVQKIIDQVGEENTFLPVIDAVNVAESLRKVKNISLDTIGSNGYLYFDAVGDRDVIFYNIYDLLSEGWKRQLQLLLLGETLFVTSNIQSLEPLPTSLITQREFPLAIGGKICFVLNTTFQEDNDIELNLAYFGYNYPVFPIGTSLDTLYAQGYRIFLGFSTSTSLLASIPFFDAHPDTVAISLYSTASSLRTRTVKNVYRMIPPDDIASLLISTFISDNGYTTVYFLIEAGDVYGEGLYADVSQLLDTLGIPYVRYDTLPSSNIQAFVSAVNSDVGNIGILGVVSNNVLESVISLLGNNVGSFLYSASTSLLLLRPDITNFYSLKFNPQYERNIAKQEKTLGVRTAYPLYDSVQMAIQISEKGTFDPLIGSYGYTYFTEEGDRNFIFFCVYLFSGSWNVYSLYCVVDNELFAG